MEKIEIVTFDHIQHENEKDTYIKQLEKQLKEKSSVEAFNRETYQKLCEAEETVRNMSKMVTVATDEYNALQKECEALKNLVKVYL